VSVGRLEPDLEPGIASEGDRLTRSAGSDRSIDVLDVVTGDEILELEDDAIEPIVASSADGA